MIMCVRMVGRRFDDSDKGMTTGGGMARLTRDRPLETFAPKNQLPNVLVRMFEL